MKEQPLPSPSRLPEAPCLSLEAISFLDNGPYSMTLQPGACCGLSGQSGVGKTQLLRAIADLIPFQGKIRLFGVESYRLAAPEWRRKIGMVPADPCWWYDSVGDHFDQAVMTTSFKVMLTRLGFEMDVFTWQIRRLSTGEKQRLAFLRALQLQPTVLLLDEPTSGLDRYHTSQLENIVHELRSQHDTSIVWVSHDSEQLARVSTFTAVLTAAELLVT